jgi:hypothetical protein
MRISSTPTTRGSASDSDRMTSLVASAEPSSTSTIS